MFGITSNFRKKKGNILDIPILIVMLFGFAGTIIISFILLSSFNDKFQELTVEPEVKTMVSDSVTSYTNVFDKIFIFVYVGLTIAICISAFFVETHPIFLGVFVILLIIYVLISGFLSDGFSMMMTSEQISAASSQFPNILGFFDKLPLYVLITTVLVIISLMIRPRERYT